MSRYSLLKAALAYLTAEWLACEDFADDDNPKSEKFSLPRIFKRVSFVVSLAVDSTQKGIDPMPSSHPIPTIAALALSLYASDRRVERLPVVTEYTGHVEISRIPEGSGVVMMHRVLALRSAGLLSEYAGGDL